ncbi:hypothetical protein Mro03_49280 [Microbispora rosea subsp. rosea]|nr:hypothetical protein Mro03_49280 [Microbispora rosea subsp. rosea]
MIICLILSIAASVTATETPPLFPRERGRIHRMSSSVKEEDAPMGRPRGEGAPGDGTSGQTRVQRWLDWPLQDQMMIFVPLAVPAL